MATSSFYKSSGSTPAVENSIQTAVTQAAGSASSAATSATQASTSATNAQSSLNSFQQYYLGAYSTPPSTSQSGALYFDSNTNQLKIWTGSAWEVTAAASNLQSTDGLPEGSNNLYFTNERTDDRVAGLLQAGNNITLAYDDAGGTLTISSTASGGGSGGGSSTFIGLNDTLGSYTGHAYKYLMVNATQDGISFDSPTTDQITEGTNLYFTDSRAVSAVTSADLDMSGRKVLFGNMYANLSDLPSATTYHGMFAHVHATGKGYFAHGSNWIELLDASSSTTTNLTEGTNLYYTDARVSAHLNTNSATMGQYLSWNGSDFVWAAGSGGASTFVALTDTPATLTANKYVKVNANGNQLEYANALSPTSLTVTNNAASGGGSLTYIPSSGNSATLQFTPPDLSSYITGITGESLYSLSNVYTSSAPTDGQVLTWDNTNSYWKPTTIATGGGSSGGLGAYGVVNSTTGSASASGTDAVSIGRSASGGGGTSVAIGKAATSGGQYSVAIGDSASAAASSSMAFGLNSNTGSYSYSIAFGKGATVTANNQLMLGSPSGYTGALTSIRVANTSYAPSNAMDLTTKTYVDTAVAGAGGGGIALTDLSASNGVAGNASLSYNNSTGAFTFTPPDLSGYATTSSLATVATSGAYGDLSGTPSLATVATSGAYGDLSGTPNLSSYLTGITGESLYSLSNVYTSSSPTDGQVLTWDNTNNYWKPTTVATSSGGLGSYGGVNSSGTGVTVSGADGIAIGLQASAVAARTIAIGRLAYVSHDDSVVIGGGTSSASRQLTLGAVNNTQGFTSVRVGNTAYTPTVSMDLTTKQYVDNNAGIALTDLSVSTATASGAGSLAYNNTTGVFTFTPAASSGGGGGSTYLDVNSSGTAASAGGSNAIAIGQSASAPIQDSIAIGNGANVTSSPIAWQGIAIGLNAQAANGQGVAIGEYAKAESYGLALGSYADANNNYSTGVGSNSQATQDYSTAVGYGAKGTASNTTAVGAHVECTGQYAIAVGAGQNSSIKMNIGQYSTAMGYRANANTFGLGLGAFCNSNGQFATAVGYSAIGYGNYSVALGYNAYSSGNAITLGSTSNGSLRCNVTSITSLSDHRDKVEIEDLDIGLDFVKAITPKKFYRNERGRYYDETYTQDELQANPELTQSYTFNQANYEAATEKEEKREFGWIAQDVDAALPDGHDARLTFNETDLQHGYDVQRFTSGDMVPILWKALKELSDKNDALEARIAALENA